MGHKVVYQHHSWDVAVYKHNPSNLGCSVSFIVNQQHPTISRGQPEWVHMHNS